MEQPSVEKALKLISYLSTNNGYSIKQLASFLRTTIRSIYRYIETFRECGYVIGKNKSSVYYISDKKEDLPDFSKLVMFSSEEAQILDTLLDCLIDSNPLKLEIRRKLSIVCDTIQRMQYSVIQERARNVEMLGLAIRKKVQVILRGYQSGHSCTIRDRVVEAYAFTDDAAYIMAYDHDIDSIRMFKISRMKSVEITDIPWQAEDKHVMVSVDVFRMTGVPEYSVTLNMSLRAKNLLIEEYPLSIKCIKRYPDGRWRFHDKVCQLEGVGRFVLGLPTEIKVVKSPELREYIRTMSSLSLSNNS